PSTTAPHPLSLHAALPIFTTARIDLPEIRQRIVSGDIVPDGRVVLDSGEIRVTKAAIDPVWHLPGIAARFGVAEPELRRTLFERSEEHTSELQSPCNLVCR